MAEETEFIGLEKRETIQKLSEGIIKTNGLCSKSVDSINKLIDNQNKIIKAIDELETRIDNLEENNE